MKSERYYKLVDMYDHLCYGAYRWNNYVCMNICRCRQVCKEGPDTCIGGLVEHLIDDNILVRELAKRVCDRLTKGRR